LIINIYFSVYIHIVKYIGNGNVESLSFLKQALFWTTSGSCRTPSPEVGKGAHVTFSYRCC